MNQTPFKIHIVFWLFMTLFVLDYHWYENSWHEAAAFSISEVVGYLILFYFSMCASNRWENKIWRLVLVNVLVILTYVGFLRLTGLEYYFYDHGGFRNLFSMTLNAILFTGLGVFFYFISRNQKIREHNLKLKAKNRQLQIHAIKSRIRPHFIFNSLNNLNALILKKDKDLSKFIDAFSNILRYSLDENEGKDIPLNRELSCIKSYFDLMQMQQPASTNLDFYVEGSPRGKSIQPFILLTLVENAFKHSNIQNSIDGFVNMHVSIGDVFETKIWNSFEGSISNRESGLSLIRQQLTNRYGQSYSFEVNEMGKQFVCTLRIFSSKINDK